MTVFHIIWMMSDIFDHVFEQVVAREYGVELAGFIIGLKNKLERHQLTHTVKKISLS